MNHLKYKHNYKIPVDGTIQFLNDLRELRVCS